MKQMRHDVFDKLEIFLGNLEQSGIHYTLAHNRDNAIMVTVVVPGGRWEVEFLNDGSVEVERFTSSGEIYGEEVLDELFVKYSDSKNDNNSELLQSIRLTTATG